LWVHAETRLFGFVGYLAYRICVSSFLPKTSADLYLPFDGQALSDLIERHIITVGDQRDNEFVLGIPSTVAEALIHRFLLSRSSKSLSKFERQNRPALFKPTYPAQTLSEPAFPDHHSEPVPFSTSPTWMLNQLRPAPSHHNRFIDRGICISGNTLKVSWWPNLGSHPQPAHFDAERPCVLSDARWNEPPL